MSRDREHSRAGLTDALLPCHLRESFLSLHFTPDELLSSAVHHLAIFHIWQYGLSPFEI